MAAPKKHDPNDPKSSPRQAIIAATIAAIEEGGEASVRVTEVAKAAGVTQGMISYYFRDREGLVSEANMERFRRATAEDNSALVEVARTAQSSHELLNILKMATRAVVSTERAINRQVRTSVIGSIANRPELHAAVATLLDELVTGTEEVVKVAKERGMLKPNLNTRAVAEVILSYTQGLIVADLDPNAPSREDIAQVIDHFLESLIVLD